MRALRWFFCRRKRYQMPAAFHIHLKK